MATVRKIGMRGSWVHVAKVKWMRVKSGFGVAGSHRYRGPGSASSVPVPRNGGVFSRAFPDCLLLRGDTYRNSHPTTYAPTMSQEGGMFSVRRPREVRRCVMIENMRRALLTRCADTGPHYQQHIRDSNASIRHETIDLANPLWRTCASDCSTSALDIRIANVPCAWQTFATELPQIIVRR
jgi:hypothetical protein